MEEKEFIVIKQDRSISVPESLRKLGVKRDHNVNTLTFNCLRFWNGHDLTDLTIYINYQRSDGEKGSSIAENVRVDEKDANIIYFDWTIKGHVTKIAGNVTISVCAKKTDEEGIEIIHWNSEGNKITYVSDGLECNGEISEQYPDVINQIQDNIDALGDVVGALPQWSQEEAPDKTLIQEGRAADAKAVGDELEKKADKDNPVFTGSISMGREADTLVGANSVALGAHVEASGKYSNAEGYRTEASGNQAHAEGHTTVAASTCQHVQGRYNIADNLNKYAHIIGNGTNTARSNAHTVDWKGNGWYAGKLTQEGVPTNDKDLTTKKYVDAELEKKADKDSIPTSSDVDLSPYRTSEKQDLIDQAQDGAIELLKAKVNQAKLPDNTVLFDSEVDEDEQKLIDDLMKATVFNLSLGYTEDMQIGLYYKDELVTSMEIVGGAGIECTGLTLDNSSVKLRDIDTGVTLVGTKEPPNATESIKWGSSDTTIATVTNAGIVTLTGKAGEVTITAYCGTQTATCLVTVIEPSWVNALTRCTGEINVWKVDTSSFDPYNPTANILPSGGSRWMVGFIPVNENEEFHIMCYIRPAIGKYPIYAYDENKQYVEELNPVPITDKSNQYANAEKTFTVPTGVKYLITDLEANSNRNSFKTKDYDI